MSSKRAGKRIRKWYDDLTFLKKTLVVYLLCAVLPMVLTMLIYYFSTVNLLMEQTYREMEQNMAAMENAINASLQPYQALMETLKHDKTLNIRLSVDYTEVSYSDLAYYMDSTMDIVTATHPYADAVCFYSDNETLPEDGYYFHPLEELGEDISDRLGADSILIYRPEGEEQEICMLSPMNYYPSANMHHYVSVKLDEEMLYGQIESAEGMGDIYLLDQEGKILCSGFRERESVQVIGYFPNAAEVTSGTVYQTLAADNISYICEQLDLDNGLRLLMARDYRELISSAWMAPLQILVLLLILTAVMFSVAVQISIHNGQRLRRVLDAMKKLGRGELKEPLPPMGNDEFGQVAGAVNETGQQLDLLIRENYKKQLQLKSSELNLLQEQINPHFLYNALAVISSLGIREDAPQTVQSIRNLADFYRISLNKGRSVITVREEIELLQAYMKIQLLRFSDLVEISYDIAEEAEKYYTIKLLLQPLVENAIHHAREEETFLSIVVRAYVERSRLCFEVEDNGIGMTEEQLRILREELQRQQEGFGIKNIDQRIRLQYGNDYGATVYSGPEQGTRVHLEIPLKSRPD